MSTQKLTLMQQLDLDHIHSVIVHHRAIVFPKVPIITVTDHQSRLNSTHGRFLQHGELTILLHLNLTAGVAP